MRHPVTGNVIGVSGERFEIISGSTQPTFQVQFTDAEDEPVDMSGYAIVDFRLSTWSEWKRAQVTDAPNGEVEYRWDEEDTDEIGRVTARFRVKYSNGNILKLPSGSPLEIQIRSNT